MQKPAWRGEWYIYSHPRGEFVRQANRAGSRLPEDPEAIYVRWTVGIRYARAFKNPSTAHKAAARINHLYAQGRTYPRNQPRLHPKVRVVSVVTGEAARCLDRINRRDH